MPTPEQKKKLLKTYGELHDSLKKAKGRDERQKLEQEAESKAEAILDMSQKKTWKEMTGAPLP